MKYIKLFESITEERLRLLLKKTWDIKVSAINFYKRLDKVKDLGSEIEDMLQAFKDDYEVKEIKFSIGILDFVNNSLSCWINNLTPFKEFNKITNYLSNQPIDKPVIGDIYSVDLKHHDLLYIYKDARKYHPKTDTNDKWLKLYINIQIRLKEFEFIEEKDLTHIKQIAKDYYDLDIDFDYAQLDMIVRRRRVDNVVLKIIL